ncbi:MAG: hypothetical protein JO319_02020, partial [Acidobacteriaceae bacterium]|nr:hypothetical protein [Acidobacteriaceae bacterium]
MPSKQQAAESQKRPKIAKVEPDAAISGGELHIRGQHLANHGRPVVRLGTQAAHLVVAGESYIIARVPEQ